MNNATRIVAAAALTTLVTATPVAAQPAAEVTESTQVDTVETPAETTTDTTDGTTKVRPGRRHGRMALEALAIQAIGTAWYWRNTGDGWGASNIVDWQLGFKGSALTAKLGMDSDGWRFDGNSFALNAICHPAFGALTYWRARENNYGVGESFLISTLVSGTWELFTEWAEYGSINDALSTSTTGVPLGEATYQLVHNWRRARYAFAAGGGTQAGDAVMASSMRVALDTTPSSGSGTIVGGSKINVGLEASFDGQGLRGTEAGAKTSIVGKYYNGENSKLFVGASSEFYYRDNAQREGRDWDMLSTVTVGPTVDAQLRRGDTTIDVGIDVYADFGMLKAAGHDSWRSTNEMAKIRNSMQDKAKPYYYARGFTVDPRINVSHKGLSVGGKLVLSRFDSLDGADRDQEMMTADPHMADTDATAQAWVGYSHKNLTLAVDGRMQKRTGSMGGAHGDASSSTTMLTVAYQR